MKEEFDFQASFAELAFAKLRVEDALKCSERECDDLRLKNTKLEEEKIVMSEHMKKAVSIEVLKVKNEMGVTESRQIQTLISEQTGKLDALKKREKECLDLIDELNEKVFRLEEKRKRHADKKKMFMDREARSEEKYRKLVVDRKSEGEIHRAKVSELEGEKRDAEGLVELYKRSEIKLGARVSQLEKAVVNLLIEPQETPEDVGDTIATRGGLPSKGVVQIIDSDDEVMEHNTVGSGLKRKSASPFSDCDSTDSYVDWKSEKDIRSALKNDHELCMRALCALYKEKCFQDAVRGTSLAEFLTDKLPLCTLKKSILELRKHDSKGLDDCKRIAMEYSKKLFEIYIKYGDSRFILRKAAMRSCFRA